MTIYPTPASAQSTTDAPLSHQQQRIWTLEQISQPSAAQNIAIAVRLEGRLSPSALQAAMDRLVERHAALRTGVVVVGGTPYQRVHDVARVWVERIDMRDTPLDERGVRALQTVREHACRPFAGLEVPPLARAVLCACHSSEHLLGLTFHHLVADGWSLQILISELAALYQEELQGEPAARSAPAVTYAAYAKKQHLDAGATHRHSGHWISLLSGAPQQLEFPTDRRRAAGQSTHAATVRASICADDVARLLVVAEAETASTFMALFAAFQVFVAKQCGTSDFLIGVPFACRDSSDLDHVVGCFVNPVVMRSAVRGQRTFRELLRAVREMSLDALEHQSCPLTSVVNGLRCDRVSDTPLFQVMFAWQNAPRLADGDSRASGLSWAAVPIDVDSTQLDLTFLLDRGAHGVRVSLIYKTALFLGRTAERLLERFATLVRWVSEYPDEPLSGSTLISTSEREWILEHATVEPQTFATCDLRPVHELFFAQAERSPDAKAITGVATWTYGELARAARRVASRLDQAGIRRSDRVALTVDRSERVAAAMLGIMSRGGTCVMLDPAAPAERLWALIRDCGARVLLTDCITPSDLAAAAGPVAHVRVLDLGQR